MTRSRNSRRGSEAVGSNPGSVTTVRRPYAGSYVQSKTRAQRHACFDLNFDDLDFDRWEEAEYADAEVEADSNEEQLWTALSATTATQLPSDPHSDDWDAASKWALVSTAESSWVVEWEAGVAQSAAVLAPWPEVVLRGAAGGDDALAVTSPVEDLFVARNAREPVVWSASTQRSLRI